MNVPRRFFRFGLAVAVTATLIAWAARTTWREVRQLRASFSLVESDSFHLFDYIEAMELRKWLDARTLAPVTRNWLSDARQVNNPDVAWVWLRAGSNGHP